MGVAVGTAHCPSCRAKGRDRRGDNLVLYKDGSKHCFACGYNVTNGKQPQSEDWMDDSKATAKMDDVGRLPMRALVSRNINQSTARQYGVRVEYDGNGLESKYYFPLYTGGSLTGYQVKVARAPGNRQKGDVWRMGQMAEALPFGANLMPAGGKMLIVTEGGEDCLAASQMLLAQGKKYRVVSCLGVDGWNKNIPFFEKFQKVLIAFDQDDPGREGATKFASALSPGKALIARWQNAVDPNELLFNNPEGDQFLDAVYNAEPFQPSGILTGEAVWEAMQNYVKPLSIDYPEEWEGLQHRTQGMRESEISMWTAGTSVGKTSYIRRLKSHILSMYNFQENPADDWPIGEIELEEAKEKTWRGLMQFHMHKRWADMTQEERRQAYEETYGTRRIHTYDHRSQHLKGQSLMDTMKHMHYGNGARIIFLDHVTLAVNEFGEGHGLNAQDKMMSEFLQFVESTKCHLCLISHLRKAAVGTESFERGAVPSEDDLKGSGSLKQISFDIIGVSRDKMHEDEYIKNVSTTHVLKCRETGDTGRCDDLYWDNTEQKLVKAILQPEPEEEGDFV